MPKRTDIQSILIIGAGPIIIGQACEFDYSGVQACKALREEGYKVQATADGASALRMLDADTGIRLLFTDVVLPDENAFDVIPRIKKLRPTLPVIVMSAKNTIMTAISVLAGDIGATFFKGQKDIFISRLAMSTSQAFDQNMEN